MGFVAFKPWQPDGNTQSRQCCATKGRRQHGAGGKASSRGDTFSWRVQNCQQGRRRLNGTLGWQGPGKRMQIDSARAVPFLPFI